MRCPCGNDTLNGADGTDNLQSGAGNDTVRGGAGYDQLYGGTGNNFLQDGGTDRNVLRGESGNDRLTIDVDPGMTTGTIHDRSILDGGSGTDTLVFNTALPVTMYAGDSMIFGETGPFDWDNAILLGGPVNTPAGDPKAYADFSGIERFDFSGSTGRLTYISLDPAADLTVIGTNSATGDEFQDGDGDERLFGLTGNDVLALWGGGNDVLDGGAGDDTFRVGFLGPLGAGADRIEGFEGAGAAGGDIIDIWRLHSAVSIEEVGGSTVFSYEGGSLTVDAVGLQLNQDYFVFLS